MQNVTRESSSSTLAFRKPCSETVSLTKIESKPSQSCVSRVRRPGYKDTFDFWIIAQQVFPCTLPSSLEKREKVFITSFSSFFSFKVLSLLIDQVISRWYLAIHEKIL